MGLLGRIGGLVRGGVRSALRGDGGTAERVITDLSPEDHQLMDRHRDLVLAGARTLYGTAGWTRSGADVPVLQRMVDDDAFTDRHAVLPAVSVVLGDAVLEDLGARWAALMDQEATVVVLHARGRVADIRAVVVEHAERGGLLMTAVVEEVRGRLR